MTYKTHMLSTFIVGELVAVYSDIIDTKEKAIGFFIALLFGSLFPDIDEEKSKISKMLPSFVSRSLNKLSHRGFTHNILGISFFFVLSYFGLSMISPDKAVVITLGFMTGVISHVFGDMVTYSGVPLIPGLQNIKIPIFGNFKVGTSGETKVYLFFSFVQIFLISYFLYGRVI